MYHRSKFATTSGVTMGMSFIATGSTKYVTNTNIEYVVNRRLNICFRNTFSYW
jgi:hypothetical protein